MYIVENKCVFLFGDIVGVFIFLWIFCVVGVFEVKLENRSFDGMEEFVRIS